MTRTPPPKQPKTPQEALMAQINQALPLIEAAGLADADAIARVKAEKAKFERHLNNLDYFTRVYAPLGWTPYDNMCVDMMETVTNLDIAAGETHLVSHYLSADALQLFEYSFRRQGYVAWRDMLVHALSRLRGQDFMSAVPLLLMVTDGICQHHLQKSAFGGAADQEVFDSLTTALNSLSHALSLAGRTRRKLSTEALTTPYRNGILHGRDVNFGHAIVAAKAVNLLRAMLDYIDKRADEASRIERAIADQQPPDLMAIASAAEERRAFKHALDSWKPRPPREGVFATNESASGLEPGTPELAAVSFLKAAATKNYGKLAELTLDFTRRTPAKWAGDLRRDYDELSIQKWSFGWLNDTASAATEGLARVSGSWRGQAWSGQISIRLNYVDAEMDALPRDLPSGRWVVFASAFAEMWQCAFAAARSNAAMSEAS